jgi:murein DD-endopeptidase MepM/ murein hydrolase activator NlpD
MFDPPDGRPWLLYALLGCSLALNVVMVLDRDTPAEPETAAEGTASAEPAADAVADGVADAVVPTAQAAVAEPAGPAPEPLAGDWSVVRGSIDRSLSGMFVQEAETDGEGLSQVFSRLFVWDMDLRRDLRKGDTIETSWRKNREGIIEIAGARFHSQKQGKTIAAYRWKAPGDTYASYWMADGTEVPHQLQNPPLKEYEQITSLLKDRPTHKGMDFKAPVGTPVITPFAGTVTRANWNWASNGNCIEVRFQNGDIAKFLHLAENKVKEGDTLSAGDVVGLVGNTGHSYAPHLHYQVEVGGKVVDPVDYHGTVRRRVDGVALENLRAEIARHDALLDQPG